MDRARIRPARVTYTGPRTYARSVIASLEKVEKPSLSVKRNPVEPSQVKSLNEPVIFCGQNFKEQPQVLTPDIEFGFGVNDFIDSAKTQVSYKLQRGQIIHFHWKILTILCLKTIGQYTSRF